MKKLLIILLTLGVLIIGCTHTSTSSKKVADKYAKVTPASVASAISDCEDDGRWWMHIGGVGVVVLHLKKCLDVEDMLVMITPTNSHTPEIRKMSVKLLGLHFLEHLKVKDPNSTWSLEHIKTFPVAPEDDEPGKLVSVSKIVSKSKPKETK